MYKRTEFAALEAICYHIVLNHVAKANVIMYSL